VRGVKASPGPFRRNKSEGGEKERGSRGNNRRKEWGSLKFKVQSLKLKEKRVNSLQ
jgi:hypothetical protein